MSTLVRGTGALVLAMATLFAAPLLLRAQCPDGTPPPCGPPRAPPPKRVAVLYFGNLSRDPADQYLADGLTDEVIVRLGQVRRLEVVSRFEVQRFQSGYRGDVARLGRLLNAEYVVSGSVRRVGSQVRVAAELVRARTRRRVWGDVFDRANGDVLTIEEDIARAVVERIAGQLLPAERSTLARRPTRDAVAYDLYLRGNYLAARFTEPDLRAAIELYEQAIARDSAFALAYRGLAYAWSFLADDFLPARDAYPQAKRAIEQALAIDSSAALLGWTLPMLVLDFDVPRAEARARRALDLDPDLPDANWGMMWVRWAQGRMDEAAVYSRRAWDRDTLSFPGAVLHVLALVTARRYDELEVFLPHVAAVVPPAELRGTAGIVRQARGDCEGAAAALRTARQFVNRWHFVPALVCAGHQAEARAQMDSLLTERRLRYVPGTILAFGFASLGQLDDAFAWLDPRCRRARCGPAVSASRTGIRPAERRSAVRRVAASHLARGSAGSLAAQFLQRPRDIALHHLLPPREIEIRVVQRPRVSPAHLGELADHVVAERLAPERVALGHQDRAACHRAEDNARRHHHATDA